LVAFFSNFVFVEHEHVASCIGVDPAGYQVGRACNRPNQTISLAWAHKEVSHSSCTAAVQQLYSSCCTSCAYTKSLKWPNQREPVNPEPWPQPTHNKANTSASDRAVAAECNRLPSALADWSPPPPPLVPCKRRCHQLSTVVHSSHWKVVLEAPLPMYLAAKLDSRPISESATAFTLFYPSINTDCVSWIQTQQPLISKSASAPTLIARIQAQQHTLGINQH
jgi:hypothetical protein